MRPLRCLIVGGGISGLSAAFYLEREALKAGLPIEISLFEASDKVGGKIQTARSKGCVIERGPDTLLATKPDGVRLVKELGLEGEIISPSTSGFSVLWNGALYEISLGFMQGGVRALQGLLRTPLLSLTGKIDCLLRALVQSCEANGDESVSTYAKRRWGTQLFVRMLEPLLAGVHSGNAGRLSMMALHPRYLTRIPKMRAQKSLGAKTSPFLSLKDGMAGIPERIVEKLTYTKFFTNSSVSAVVELSEDAAVIELASGKMIDTDIVLLATPAYVSAKILCQISPKAAELLLQIPYASTAVASFLFPAGTLTGPAIGTGFLIPSAQQGVLSGCTVVSSKWSGRAPDDSVLIRVFIGNADTGQELVRREHLLDEAEAELRSILGISESVLHREITVWENGVPQYEIGHLDRIKMLKAELTPWSNLKVVGAAIEGMGIPDCVRQARVAAEALVERAILARGASSDQRKSISA